MWVCQKVSKSSIKYSKFCFSGVCDMESRGSAKYYTNNQEHLHSPSEKRVFLDELDKMERIEMLPSINENLKYSEETGYTGLTTLHRLYFFVWLKSIHRFGERCNASYTNKLWKENIHSFT